MISSRNAPSLWSGARIPEDGAEACLSVAQIAAATYWNKHHRRYGRPREFSAAPPAGVRATRPNVRFWMESG